MVGHGLNMDDLNSSLSAMGTKLLYGSCPQAVSLSPRSVKQEMVKTFVPLSVQSFQYNELSFLDRDNSIKYEEHTIL